MTINILMAMGGKVKGEEKGKREGKGYIKVAIETTDRHIPYVSSLPFSPSSYIRKVRERERKEREQLHKAPQRKR